MWIDRRLMLTASLCAIGAGVSGCKVGDSSKRNVTPAQNSEDDSDIRAAFQFSYPIYEYARVVHNRTKAVDGRVGTLNQLRHRSILMDHTYRNVTAPNVDTLYSSVFLDLAGGPIVLNVPTNKERYFSIAFMNVLTDNFAYIGTRATGGNGGQFLIVGPGWEGDKPDNVIVLRSPSNDVWMLGRTLVNGRDDLDAAVEFQTQISIQTPETNLPARPFGVDATALSFSARSFLAIVNDMLSRSTNAGGELSRAGEFKSLGIGAECISPSLIDRWEAFLPRGLAELREVFLYRDLVVDGWAYQEKGVGNFGTNDRLRAGVALGGLAALGEEEAMYFHANLDPDGGPLSGEKSYRWKVPAGGVPADAFWSLTMYEAYPDGRYFLVENKLNRYSIGDRTDGLLIENDGSFEILIQHDAPPVSEQANWLPAPRGRFRLALRAYLPQKQLLEREWTVPPLLRS